MSKHNIKNNVNTQQNKNLNFNKIHNHKVNKEITQSSQRNENHIVMTLCALSYLCG